MSRKEKRYEIWSIHTPKRRKMILAKKKKERGGKLRQKKRSPTPKENKPLLTGAHMTPWSRKGKKPSRGGE